MSCACFGPRYLPYSDLFICRTSELAGVGTLFKSFLLWRGMGPRFEPPSDNDRLRGFHRRHSIHIPITWIIYECVYLYSSLYRQWILDINPFIYYSVLSHTHILCKIFIIHNTAIMLLNYLTLKRKDSAIGKLLFNFSVIGYLHHRGTP